MHTRSNLNLLLFTALIAAPGALADPLADTLEYAEEASQDAIADATSAYDSAELMLVETIGDATGLGEGDIVCSLARDLMCGDYLYPLYELFP